MYMNNDYSNIFIQLMQNQPPEHNINNSLLQKTFVQWHSILYNAHIIVISTDVNIVFSRCLTRYNFHVNLKHEVYCKEINKFLVNNG
jgi:hypothetical protein